MIHVSNLQRATSDHERKRLARVYANWKTTLSQNPDLKTCYVCHESLARGSHDIVVNGIRETADAPFVKDLIELGFRENNNIVIFTNGDAHFYKESIGIIRENINSGNLSSFYSHRHNFFKPLRNQLSIENGGGQWFEGVDLVVVSRSWWEENKDSIPDLLLGFQGWDWVFRFAIGRQAMNQSLNSPFILTYHEFHHPYWFDNILTAPGQLYNRRLCKEWVDKNPQFRPLWRGIDGY